MYKNKKVNDVFPISPFSTNALKKVFQFVVQFCLSSHELLMPWCGCGGQWVGNRGKEMERKA